jgi:hypothetical protein
VSLLLLKQHGQMPLPMMMPSRPTIFMVAVLILIYELARAVVLVIVGIVDIAAVIMHHCGVHGKNNFQPV